MANVPGISTAIDDKEAARKPRRKRASRPSHSERLAAIEARLSAAINLADLHWLNYEELGHRHNELIERHSELVAHTTYLTEQLSELKIASFTRNAVLSQIVALVCSSLGARPLDIHRHCQTLSKEALELSFPDCSPEQVARWRALVADVAEAQISGLAERIASLNAGKDDLPPLVPEAERERLN
ncbi:hypothetical protein [Hyphomicrobium sp. CS1BSMeth3]|uniref:hypothetical protein n=1 Tax=Hyphomicrobium sp. CS1BSMeth3 TaxID=1892844 RepID=UPI0009305C0F|nr:hypothetical protein [Hyphomicrobium sp. CS1BSMeth3]